MKTLLTGIAIVFFNAGSAAWAGPDISDLTRQFAYCAGRLSAQMEFQWLMSDPASDRTQSERAAMIGLVEAVAQPGQGKALLNLRIEAKQAQARLLSQALFHDDREIQLHAKERAENELAQCRSLLLG